MKVKIHLSLIEIILLKVRKKRLVKIGIDDIRIYNYIRRKENKEAVNVNYLSIGLYTLCKNP